MKKIILVLFVITRSLMADGYFWSEKTGVAPVTDTLYKKECASCHFAYQPGLLPSKSWNKIMLNLKDHFGTDASLDDEDNRKISKYLIDNSAEKFTQYKRSRKINESILANEIPIAVTKVDYFKRKHNEIGKHLIRQKEVGSLSNCIACHATAQRGIYSERDIKIPNYGRWEDD